MAVQACRAHVCNPSGLTRLRATSSGATMAGVRVWGRRVTAATVALAGATACVLAVAAPTLRGFPNRILDQLIHAAVAAAFIGAGVVAALRRRGNATGLLM